MSRSYYSTMTRRLDAAGHRLLSFIKMGFFLAVLCSGCFLVYEAYHSPKYQKYLPAIAHNSIKDMRTMYHDSFSDDLVVFTKRIQAKKLLAKNQRIVRYKNGLAGRVQTKMFQLNQDMDAFVKVESFHGDKYAAYMMRSHGGDQDDQVEVGHPSFFKSHGLEDAGNYALTIMAVKGSDLVSITIYQSLSESQMRIAQGSQYENFMTNLADKNLPLAVNIAKKQMDRLRYIHKR